MRTSLTGPPSSSGLDGTVYVLDRALAAAEALCADIAQLDATLRLLCDHIHDPRGSNAIEQELYEARVQLPAEEARTLAFRLLELRAG